MRVLHVAEAFGGGVYEMVCTLSCGLRARGHDVAIAYGVRPETPHRVEDCVDDDVDIFPMPWTSRSPKAQIQSFRALRRVAGDWRPDVVHLHSSFAGAVGSRALARNFPTVYTPHGYHFDGTWPEALRWVYRHVERGVASRVTAIGAVSPSEAELADDLGSARRIVTVPNGIAELDAPEQRTTPLNGSPRVVAAGRVMTQRQPRQAAEILKAVGDVAAVEWIGGGRPDDCGHLEALAAAGVPVTGWLPRHEAMSRLSEATAYVHWTAWDGHPLSILEAAARDVVVVASDIPANRDVLGPEQTFASPRDASSFVRRILDDPGLRERVVREQRERVKPYGAEAMVDGWLALYSSL